MTLPLVFEFPKMLIPEIIFKQWNIGSLAFGRF